MTGIDFNILINLFSGQFFFKTFSIVFSLLFSVYALVIFKQTQVMIKTIDSKNNSLILLISFLQIFVGLGLFIFSLLL